jgi:hypothetical protein
MPLTRRQDWPEQLVSAMAEKNQMPFSFGKHDCCISVCDVVLAMTDVDLADKFRGYKTSKGAKNRLKEYDGVKGIAEMMAEEYAIVEVTRNHAQRGDVALVEDTVVGDTLGLVDSSGMYIAVPGKKGWSLLPKEKGVKFWRI